MHVIIYMSFLEYATELLLREDQFQILMKGQSSRHCIYNQPVDEVIDLLENLKFTFHNPNPNSQRFVNLKSELKPRDMDRPSAVGFRQTQDPYLIAAYLRFWKNGFEDRTRGMQDNLGLEWEHSPPPNFNIAIRFGSLSSEEPFDFRLMDREIFEWWPNDFSWLFRWVMALTWMNGLMNLDHTTDCHYSDIRVGMA